MSGGVSNQYEAVLSANPDGTGGTVLGTANYGVALILGDGLNGAIGTFAADGASAYSITLRDFDDPTCHSEFVATSIDSCSNCKTNKCIKVTVIKN